MPEKQLGIVESGVRSTLYADREGNLYRKYHDTGTWDGPLLCHVDDRGVVRHSANRRVASLVESAWSLEFRGSKAKPPPQHLQIALRHLTHEPVDIDQFADMCSVKLSTAWSYACKIAEHWPGACVVLRRFVYPSLMDICDRRRTELKGDLKTAMGVVRQELGGDTTWRCLPDHYAHLRLARLCAESMDSAP